jgi:hypothetical protein
MSHLVLPSRGRAFTSIPDPTTKGMTDGQSGSDAVKRIKLSLPGMSLSILLIQVLNQMLKIYSSTSI